MHDAHVSLDSFYVVALASKAIDGVRREQQKSDPALNGMAWSLLKHADRPYFLGGAPGSLFPLRLCVQWSAALIGRRPVCA